jgi:hypothetical protein
MLNTQFKGALTGRDPKFIDADTVAVRWIAQTAVNVELFTIPLYMTSLYSIAGMHAITGKNSDFYKGRQWPGAKAAPLLAADKSKPGWGNQKAFNIIFSVFIQEMLHLQMAANIATAIGVSPSFTSSALQSPEHGWTCYGRDVHVIPNIVDLRDTDNYTNVAVNTGPVDKDTVSLFLAIEQPFDVAEHHIVRNQGDYSTHFPFHPGTSLEGVKFGSIGNMYHFYREYLSIAYSDGTTLWDHVFSPDGQQNDLFNGFSFPGHPMREYMGVETTIALTDKDIAFRQALDLMHAITDQGEGATLKARLKAKPQSLLSAVQKRYCPDPDALHSDYPSYSDTGEQVASGDAAARIDNDGRDHFERFQDIQALLDEGGILTWDRAAKAGKWTADDLVTSDYEPSQDGSLPGPDQIAQALNNLYADNPDHNHKVLSQAVVGAIKGVTTVLDQYWNPAPGATVGFPFPSMVGSGDRMSIAWAIFGRTPDLSVGIPAVDTGIVNHACQGLSLSHDEGTVGTNSCAETNIFHSCRGSNLCKGMGGCGFVQASTGGGSGCRGLVAGAAPTPGNVGGQSCSAVQMRVYGGLCGGPTPPPTPGGETVYTAPSDNICGGFGGCAVPISACQKFPKSGIMEVRVLTANPPPPPPPLVMCDESQPPLSGGKNLCGAPGHKTCHIRFSEGERVEDVAYRAFAVVAKELKLTMGPKQEPNDLRLAFPPST